MKKYFLIKKTRRTRHQKKSRHNKKARKTMKRRSYRMRQRRGGAAPDFVETQPEGYSQEVKQRLRDHVNSEYGQELGQEELAVVLDIINRMNYNPQREPRDPYEQGKRRIDENIHIFLSDGDDSGFFD